MGETGCIAKKGFLVERSGKVFLLLDLVGFLIQEERNLATEGPPPECSTRKPFFGYAPGFYTAEWWLTSGACAANFQRKSGGNRPWKIGICLYHGYSFKFKEEPVSAIDHLLPPENSICR